MSKITISTVLTIIRIVLTLGEKLVRLIYTIIDICDDGIVNFSFDKPAWYDSLVRVIGNIQESLRDICDVSNELSGVILSEKKDE